MKLIYFTFVNLILTFTTLAQFYKISGRVVESSSKKEKGAFKIVIQNTNKSIEILPNGKFVFDSLTKGNYTLIVSENNSFIDKKSIEIIDKDIEIDFYITEIATTLEEVDIKDTRQADVGKLHLRGIEGVGIYESKKSEVINIEKINVNLSIDNPREAYSKIPGLNIWESDESGVQLGIGSRGLSPNRSSNFNIKQNGYDISADAIGYPESYYTPPLEAVEKIEILRGAASLQYGTQFGGMINFVMKDYKSATKPWSLHTSHTVGSYGFYKGSIWMASKHKKTSASLFYQFRRGNAWRQNSAFQVHTSFFTLNHTLNERCSISFDYTLRHNLAQQPGGLNDYWFALKPDSSFRARNWFKVIWNVAALNFNYDFSNKTKFNIKVFSNFSYRESLGNLDRISRIDLNQNRTIIYDHFVNVGAEARLLHKYRIKNISAAFATGCRVYKGFTDSKQGDGTASKDADFRLLNPENPEKFSYKFHNYNASFFIENLFFITDKWTVTPGLRIEYIETNMDGYYRFIQRNRANDVISDNKFAENKSIPRAFVLAGVGSSYRPNSSIEIYGNISQNYRAVTFSDIRIQNPNFKIDPNIQDEKGITSDVGIRGTIKKIFNYDFSLFYLYYSNRIGEIFKSDDAQNFFIPYVWRTNISDSQTFGLEFFGEMNWIELLNKNYQGKHSLSTFVTTSINNAKYISADNPQVFNKIVENTPMFSARSGVTYSYKNWSSTITFCYISQQFADATNLQANESTLGDGLYGIIPTYHVADFSSKYNFSKFYIEASINNFTNQLYFTRRATSYPGPGIMPATPIRFFISFGIKI